VIGLPAGQFLGTLIGWRWTFAVTAAATVMIVLVQPALLPKIPAIGTMTFGRLADVVRVRGSRPILLAAAVITIGQFAASTFVTPFLLRNGHLGAGTTSALFLGYGIAGIGGTLLGGPLVARSRVLTFAGASATIGVVLVLLPIVAGIPLAVGVLYVAWGLIWGLVPLALQTLMLTATPSAPEAGSAVLITVMQLALGAGSALGGVLVDSAGLAAVFFVSGPIAVAAALAGLHARRAPVSA
jgi:predicted MFS family arabinose efflux permease